MKSASKLRCVASPFFALRCVSDRSYTILCFFFNTWN